jgi:hypothetical protein
MDVILIKKKRSEMGIIMNMKLWKVVFSVRSSQETTNQVDH